MGLWVDIKGEREGFSRGGDGILARWGLKKNSLIFIGQTLWDGFGQIFFGIMTEQRNAPSSYLHSGILEKTLHTGRRCGWLFGYEILLHFCWIAAINFGKREEGCRRVLGLV